MSTTTPPVETVHDLNARPLSTNCRILDRLRPTERLLAEGESTCVGSFSCRPDDPLFHTESASTAHCLVFSRTPVWIRHERGPRYVADPTVATFHSRGRVYQRWRIIDRGDRCDWIAYADDLVADAVSRFDRANVASRVGRGASGRDPLWFPLEFVPVSSQLYARQRRFFERLSANRGDPDRDGVDEEAILLLDAVLAAVTPRAVAPPAVTPAAGRLHAFALEARGRQRRRQTLDAIQHVRAVIASAPVAPPSLRALARAVAMSPFQLCRAFSHVSGETMTQYRLRLRLLASLERLRAGDPLVDVALACGFSSHSHFSASFRAAFGTTPTSWRGQTKNG